MHVKQELQLEDRTFRLKQQKSVLQNIDPLDWLQSQGPYPKMFWQDKKGGEIFAASGSVISLDTIPKLQNTGSDTLRFFGGMSFSSKRPKQVWDFFPECLFFLPASLLHQHHDRTEWTKTMLEDQILSFPPISYLPSAQNNHCKNPQLVRRLDTPSFNVWENNLKMHLKKIKENELRKIVLARQSTFITDSLLDPLEILRFLRPFAQNSTLFALQLSKNQAFIGATPEKLYERSGRHIISDVLAGTRPRGKSLNEDLQLQRELFEHPKDRNEFLIVKEFIAEKLSALCDRCAFDEGDSIFSTQFVHHIFNQCSGLLKEGVTDQDIISMLHPTPAVCGIPLEIASSSLEKTEPFNRGWYASPIGWMSNKQASIGLGIRSALIDHEKLYLFAGTGIVAGSEPKKEWTELEHKIAPFQRLFA